MKLNDEEIQDIVLIMDLAVKHPWAHGREDEINRGLRCICEAFEIDNSQHRFYMWRKYKPDVDKSVIHSPDPERQVCTAEHPWTPGSPYRWMHPDATFVRTADTKYGQVVVFRCPHCKLEFGEEVPD